MRHIALYTSNQRVLVSLLIAILLIILASVPTHLIQYLNLERALLLVKKGCQHRTKRYGPPPPLYRPHRHYNLQWPLSPREVNLYIYPATTQQSSISPELHRSRTK